MSATVTVIDSPWTFLRKNTGPLTREGHQYLGGTIQEHINICTKYGFDALIISDSYGGYRRHTTDDR